MLLCPKLIQTVFTIKWHSGTIFLLCKCKVFTRTLLPSSARHLRRSGIRTFTLPFTHTALLRLMLVHGCSGRQRHFCKQLVQSAMSGQFGRKQHAPGCPSGRRWLATKSNVTSCFLSVPSKPLTKTSAPMWPTSAHHCSFLCWWLCAHPVSQHKQRNDNLQRKWPHNFSTQFCLMATSICTQIAAFSHKWALTCLATHI